MCAMISQTYHLYSYPLITGQYIKQFAFLRFSFSFFQPLDFVRFMAAPERRSTEYIDMTTISVPSFGCSAEKYKL